MRIVHLGDIHIKNTKRHDEYRRVFDDLHNKLRKLQPDLIINVGDTAHTKTNISPEFVQLASEHFREASNIAEYHIIIGNHDMNVANLNRQDAISPIIDSINSNSLFLHKKSGLYKTKYADLWVFSLADKKNYPNPAQWEHDDTIRIGLFHGPVKSCVTDVGWNVASNNDLSMFDGLDFVMLGDIHKSQFFNSCRYAYAGSLIQQDFGEDIDKGFLLWDINDRKNFEVKHVRVDGARKFYTLLTDACQSFCKEEKIDVNSRIRVMSPIRLDMKQRRALEKDIRATYHPSELTIVSNSDRKALNEKDVCDARIVETQTKLLQDFLAERGIEEGISKKIIELDNRISSEIMKNEFSLRDVIWKMKRIEWSNLFNFGENNSIDFSSLSGIIGLFAPNGSGKSNLINVLLETCFDGTTKGLSKNIFFVNDAKESALARFEFEIDGTEYIIKRKIEKIKYGQKKFEQAKEWGRTTVEFLKSDCEDNMLMGATRPEIERSIRRTIGDYDDFVLTSLSAQENGIDVIFCKETERKRIMYKFLDLDIFEKKCIFAKEECKESMNSLKEIDDEKLDKVLKSSQIELDLYEKESLRIDSEIHEYEKVIETKKEMIATLSAKLRNIESINIADTHSKLHGIELSLSSSFDEMKSCEKIISDCENRIGKMSHHENTFDEKLHRSNVNKLSMMNDKIKNVDLDITSCKRCISSNEKKAELLSEVPCGNSFPTCKFLLDAFKAKESLPSLLSKLDNLVIIREKLLEDIDKLSRSKKVIDVFDEMIAEKNRLQSLMENKTLMLDNVKLKIDKLYSTKKNLFDVITRHKSNEDAIIENEKIENDIKLVSCDIANIVQDIRSLRSKLNIMNQKIGSTKNIIERLQDQLTKRDVLRDQCVVYGHYIDAVGKDGIPYSVLTKRLPEINDEINSTLSDVADFTVSIEHDKDEQAMKVYMQRDGKSRPIELAGGAEKMLASLAIRSALIGMSRLPKTDTVIIDEGFGKLDVKNMESIHKMLNYLKSFFERIIVISHVDVMRDMVDSTIEVTIDDEGLAHMEV